MKKTLSLLLIFSIILTCTPSVNAFVEPGPELDETWTITSTKKTSYIEEFTDAVAWLSGLSALVGFPIDTTGGIGFGAFLAGKVVGSIANVYIKREYHTSPDGFAFYEKTYFYENDDYTNLIGYQYGDINYVSP